MNTNFLKKISLHLSVFSLMNLCLQPLAIAAESKTQQQNLLLSKMKRFVEITEIHKREITVGELVQKLSANDPLAKRVFEGYEPFKNVKIPKVTPQIIKDKSGRETMRFNTSYLGKTYSIDMNDSSQNPVTINGTKYSYMDLATVLPMIQKLSKDNKNMKFSEQRAIASIAKPEQRFVYSAEDFAKLSPKKKGEFLLKSREIMDQLYKLQKIEEKSNPQKTTVQNGFDWFYQTLILPTAEAARKFGSECLNSGYFTKYGKNLSCGSDDPIFTTKNVCAKGASPCNPIVYGYDKSGNEHCVNPTIFEGKNQNDQTLRCNLKVPIATDDQKKALVDSYLQKIGSGYDPANWMEIRSYLDSLNKTISDAKNKCDNPPENIEKISVDQKLACDEIKKRAFDLKDQICNEAVDAISECKSLDKGSKCQIMCEGVGSYCPTEVSEAAQAFSPKVGAAIKTCENLNQKPQPPVVKTSPTPGTNTQGQCIGGTWNESVNECICPAPMDSHVGGGTCHTVIREDGSSGRSSSSKDEGFFSKMAKWNWAAIGIGALVVGGLWWGWNKCFFSGNKCQDADIKNDDLDSGRGTERNPTYPTTPFRPGLSF